MLSSPTQLNRTLEKIRSQKIRGSEKVPVLVEKKGRKKGSKNGCILTIQNPIFTLILIYTHSRYCILNPDITCTQSCYYILNPGHIYSIIPTLINYIINPGHINSKINTDNIYSINPDITYRQSIPIMYT